MSDDRSVEKQNDLDPSFSQYLGLPDGITDFKKESELIGQQMGEQTSGIITMLKNNPEKQAAILLYLRENHIPRNTRKIVESGVISWKDLPKGFLEYLVYNCDSNIEQEQFFFDSDCEICLILEELLKNYLGTWTFDDNGIEDYIDMYVEERIIDEARRQLKNPIDIPEDFGLEFALKIQRVKEESEQEEEL